MSKDVDLLYAFGLPPEEAVKYFESKGYTFSWDWHDTWQEAHTKAFTVAKAMRMDVLQDIREVVQKALDDGITLEQFKKELTPKLQAKGWWGKQMIGEIPPQPPLAKGGITGGVQVQLGSPRRLRTIYRTNLQTAYMAGRYKAFMDNVEDRPYWQYVAVLDSRTRPAHAALHGKVFKYDDPFWNTHYPPQGFNCRCRIRALDAENLKSRKLTPESSEGKITWEDRIVTKRGEKAGLTEQVAVYKDPLTGMKIPTDPGWSYNPGKAAWQPEIDKYSYDVAKQYIQGALTGPGFYAFFERKAGNFPVAVLSPEDMTILGSKKQTVILSAETLKEHLKSHPDLSIKDYQKIPDILAYGEVYQKADERLIYLWDEKDKALYRASLKATEDREENYFLSLFKTNEKNADRQVRNKMKRIR